MAITSALATDYTDCQVIVYDLDGNHVLDTKIATHDKVNKEVRLNIMPRDIKINDVYKLFILTSPAPCEYHGKVKKIGGAFSFAMFQGQVKENRVATRYKVTTPATLDSYISAGEYFPLHRPIKVTLINISTSGVRFRAPFYTLNDGDVFRINMTISGSDKSLIAETINHLDNEPTHSDYGCRFMN